MDLQSLTSASLTPGSQLILLPDSDVLPLAEALVALANAEGGTVVIGIDPVTHQSTGPMPDIVEQDLRSAQLQTTPHIAVDWQEENTAQGTLIVLGVAASRALHSLLDGRVLARAGSVNRIMLGPELQLLLRKRAPQEGELQPVYSASLEDLDYGLIREYQDLCHPHAQGQPGLSVTEFLKQLGALDEDLRPTVNGMLLFGNNPQQFLPFTRVIFVNFRKSPELPSTDHEHRYSRREEFTGPLSRIIPDAFDVIRKEMSQDSLVQGLARIDRTEYPLTVVREALVNALAHRDYGLTGRCVEIHMFEDSLEVISPGGLPAHITLENMLDEHYSRNPRIVRGLYHWGYIEELGLGIDLMYNDLARNGHPPPVFDATPDRVKVKMYNRRDTAIIPDMWQSSMNQRQLAAISHVQTAGSITNRKYQQLCPGVSAETLRLDLANLVERGVLLRIGEKRGTHYILK